MSGTETDTPSNDHKYFESVAQRAIAKSESDGGSEGEKKRPMDYLRVSRIAEAKENLQAASSCSTCDPNGMRPSGRGDLPGERYCDCEKGWAKLGFDQLRQNRLFPTASGVPEPLRGLKFDHLLAAIDQTSDIGGGRKDRILAEIYRRIVSEEPIREPFVIHGPPKTGKTWTMSTLPATHLARGESVLWLSYSELVTDVLNKRNSGDGDGNIEEQRIQLRALKSVDHLFLDGVDGPDRDPFRTEDVRSTEDKIWAMIQERYDSGLPVYITSVHDPRSLADWMSADCIRSIGLRHHSLPLRGTMLENLEGEPRELDPGQNDAVAAWKRDWEVFLDDPITSPSGFPFGEAS